MCTCSSQIQFLLNIFGLHLVEPVVVGPVDTEGILA